MPGFLASGLTDESTIYVPIPKNGSSSHRAMFNAAGWKKIYWGVEGSDLEAYVPIRDPIDRWFSGVDQYCRGLNHHYERIIEEVRDGRHPVLDENTLPQAEFLFSTLPNVTLVKLENAGSYVKERWGLDLPVINSRRREVDDTMGEILEWQYLADRRLYEQAL